MLAALTALTVLLGCFGLAALSVGFAVAVGIAKFGVRLAFCGLFVLLAVWGILFL